MEEALRSAFTGADRVTAPYESVSVGTSARLHFGFLDPSGRGPRPFGSFGLAIDRPQTRLSLRRGDDFKVSGVECERATPYLRAIAASFGLATPYHLHLDEAIPAHAGLGSGTQLALAIGSAVAVLEGLPLDLTGIAARLERGKRSGIGIGTFEQGGAVLDGGPSNGALPEVLWRVPFPRDWRVLLIFDPAETGVHGANEIAAFAALPDFPEAETEDLTRRIPQAALPARTSRPSAMRSATCRRRWAPISRRYKAGPMSVLALQRCSRGWRVTASPGSGKAPGGRQDLPSPPPKRRARRCLRPRERMPGAPSFVSSWRRAATSPP